MTKTMGVEHSDWTGGGLAEWTEGNTAYLSVVFSWRLPDAFQRAVWLRAQGYYVRAGGPAVTLNPDYLANVAEIGGNVRALSRHNPNAIFTSRGCVRRCPFCAVPTIEGDLRELVDWEWEPRPIVCDNNLLATSVAHFGRVIDRLKPLCGVDFNQGLDARLLRKHHADRLAELDLYRVRLAWDTAKVEAPFMRAFELLRKAGIAKRAISVYVLIGFEDTPEDALYRLESVRKLGVLPFPMRYQPLGALQRDAYVAHGWTDRDLRRMTRYWSNLVHLGGIPYGEFEG